MTRPLSCLRYTQAECEPHVEDERVSFTLTYVLTNGANQVEACEWMLCIQSASLLLWIL